VARDFTSNEKRPLVVVGYGPRCVPVMQLTEAAADICDLLWLIDASIPEMRQMTDLLNRFGPVVDISERGPDQILKELSAPYKPDGIATYLDANMTTLAQVATALSLPFHSVETAAALTDKFLQRQVLRDAGVPEVACRVVTPEQSAADLGPIDVEGRQEARPAADHLSDQGLAGRVDGQRGVLLATPDAAQEGLRSRLSGCVEGQAAAQVAGNRIGPEVHDCVA